MAFFNCTGGCGGGPRFVRRLLSVTGGGTWLWLLLLLLLMALLLLLLLLLLLCFCFLSVSLAASSSAKSTAPAPPPPPNRLLLLLLIVFSGDGDLLLLVVVAGDCAPLLPTGFSFGIFDKPSKIPPSFWPLLLSEGVVVTGARFTAPGEDTLP